MICTGRQEQLCMGRGGEGRGGEGRGGEGRGREGGRAYPGVGLQLEVGGKLVLRSGHVH